MLRKPNFHIKVIKKSTIKAREVIGSHFDHSETLPSKPYFSSSNKYRNTPHANTIVNIFRFPKSQKPKEDFNNSMDDLQEYLHQDLRGFLQDVNPAFQSFSKILSSQNEYTFDIIDKAFNKSFFSSDKSEKEREKMEEGFLQESQPKSDFEEEKTDILDQMSEFVYEILYLNL